MVVYNGDFRVNIGSRVKTNHFTTKTAVMGIHHTEHVDEATIYIINVVARNNRAVF
jgi:hypothetical protein